MKRLQNLLLSYSGRIGRGRFWLGVLCIVIATAALSAIAIALGFGETSTREGYSVINGERSEFSETTLSASPIASLLIGLVMAAPWLAIAIKRRHDRGSSGYDVVAFTALNFLAQALALFGIEGAIGTMFSVVGAVWGIALFILLGCLKGTTGSNDYGPDPLVAASR